MTTQKGTRGIELRPNLCIALSTADMARRLRDNALTD